MTTTRWTLIWAAVFLTAIAGCGKSQQTEAKKGGGSKEPASTTKSERAKSGGKGSASSAQPAKSKSSGGDTRSAATTSNDGKPSGGWYLTEADNGKHLDLRPGDRILVKVKASRANGYQWMVRDAENGVVRRDGQPIYTPASKGSGSGIESWRFRAIRPGEQTIKMEYLPPWSKTVPERVLRFTVSVAIR